MQGVDLQTSFGITVVAGAVDSLSIVPQSATVAQGASLSFTVEGSDEFGNPVDTSGAVLTSSVATDVVTGHSVAFPHASPHTITATFGASSTTSSVTINVIPAAVRLANSGQDLNVAVAAATLLGLAGLVLLALRRRRHARA